MKAKNIQRSATSFLRSSATFLAVVLGISVVSSAEAAVIVYDSHADLSVTLGGYDGRFGLSFPAIQTVTYSGMASSHIEANSNSLTALSEYGIHWSSSVSSFHTEARSSAEGFSTRDAQAEAFWEFFVTDSDSIFKVNSSHEWGEYSWGLQDLTLDSIVANGDSGGFAAGGNVLTGTLIQGHSYRLTESTRTLGTSDEYARVAFSVGTNVEFLPSAINSVPESGAWLTNAVFMLAVGGMGWRHRRSRHQGQA